MTNALRSSTRTATVGISGSQRRKARAARALESAVGAAIGARRRAPMALALAGGALMVVMNTMSAQAANGTWVQASPSGAQTLWSSGLNWASGTIADGPGFVADFSTLNPNAATNPFINLDTSRSIGQLIFGESGTANTNTWTLANNGVTTNVLTLDNTGGTGAPTINVKNNIANISLNLAGTAGVTLNGGTGSTSTTTLILSGTNTYSGTTTILSNTSGQWNILAATNSAFGTSNIIDNPGSSNGVRILLNAGVNINNNITFTTARTLSGGNSMIQTNGNLTATWSGKITINGPSTQGGDFAGPIIAGGSNFLILSGPIISTLASQPKGTFGTNAIVLRAGNVQMADTTGTSSAFRIEDRNGILQVGANNGIATNSYIEIGGNLGNPANPTTVNLDLNGFNQTLVGVSNYQNNTQAETITNSSTTAPATLTLAPADPTTDPNQAACWCSLPTTAVIRRPATVLGRTPLSLTQAPALL